MGNNIRILNSLLDDLVANPNGIDFDTIYGKISYYANEVTKEIQNSSQEYMDDVYKLIYKCMLIEYALYGKSFVEKSLEEYNVDVYKFIDYVVKHGNDSFDEFDENLKRFKRFINEKGKINLDTKEEELYKSRERIKSINNEIVKENVFANMHEETISTYACEKTKTGRRLVVKTILSAGLLLIIHAFAKNAVSIDTYNVTETTLNTISNSIESTWHPEIIPHQQASKVQNRVIVKEFSGGYNNEPTRDYEETQYAYDGKPLQYYLSLEYFGEEGEPTQKVLNVKKGDKINTYSDAYKEIELVTYEYLGTNTQPFKRIVIFLMITLFYLGLSHVTLDPDLGYSFRECIRRYKKGEENLNDILDTLEKQIKDLYDEIDNYEILKEDLRKFVGENIYLLDNPELLEQKVDDLIDRNAINKGQAKIKKQRLKTQK